MPAGTKFGWDYGARREKGYRGSVWIAQIRVGLGPVGINAPIKVPSGSGSKVLHTVQVPLRDGIDLTSRGRPKSKRRNICRHSNDTYKYELLILLLPYASYIRIPGMRFDDGCLIVSMDVKMLSWFDLLLSTNHTQYN